MLCCLIKISDFETGMFMNSEAKFKLLEQLVLKRRSERIDSPKLNFLYEWVPSVTLFFGWVTNNVTSRLSETTKVHCTSSGQRKQSHCHCHCDDKLQTRRSTKVHDLS